MIAIFELFHFGGVPKESAAGICLRADQIIDLELGADVHSAHRVIHQNNFRFGAERTSEQGLLLISAREREDIVAHVRGADIDPFLPALGKLVLQLGRNQRTSAKRGNRANADIFGDRPERKNPVALAVSGNQGDRISDLEPGQTSRCPTKNREQQFRLSMTGETGQSDDFALMRHQFDAVAA